MTDQEKPERNIVVTTLEQGLATTHHFKGHSSRIQVDQGIVSVLVNNEIVIDVNHAAFVSVSHGR